MCVRSLLERPLREPGGVKGCTPQQIQGARLSSISSLYAIGTGEGQPVGKTALPLHLQTVVPGVSHVLVQSNAAEAGVRTGRLEVGVRAGRHVVPRLAGYAVEDMVADIRDREGRLERQ